MQLEFLDKPPTQCFPLLYRFPYPTAHSPLKPASLKKIQGLPSPPCIYGHRWAISAKCLSVTPFSSLTKSPPLSESLTVLGLSFFSRKKKEQNDLPLRFFLFLSLKKNNYENFTQIIQVIEIGKIGGGDKCLCITVESICLV